MFTGCIYRLIESKSWLFKKEFSATNFEVVNVFSAIIKREDTIYKVPFGSILDLSVDKIEAGTAEKKWIWIRHYIVCKKRF